MPDIQELAATYAPIIYHANDEPNLPVNVDWFLPRTSLWFYDRTCDPPVRQLVVDRPAHADLIRREYRAFCAPSGTVRFRRDPQRIEVADILLRRRIRVRP